MTSSLTKAERLSKVAADIASCRTCTKLCQSVTNPVPGEGDPDADVMFIGEAPGAKEDETGRPFVGAAGRLLDEMLAGVGLNRKKVFITNVVKYRPPENRDPLAEEVSQCWPWLQEQIKIIEPKLIVLLGRHAMARFIPETSISQVHGRPYHLDKNVYLPLYHPAVALYNANMKATLAEDFATIPALIKQLKNN